MSDKTRPNPYEVPESSASDRARKSQQRLLQCAGCRKNTIRHFSAFMRHPQLAIVCPECGTRHRLTFARTSQFRYHAVAIPAIGLGLLAIYAALQGRTYRTIDFIVAQLIRYVEWSPSRSLISVAEATALIVILLTPLFVAAGFAFRTQLRLIAEEGILQERSRDTKH